MHNHPCSIWVRESLDNYEWLYCLALALDEEYGVRYGKQHKSVRDVILLLPDISIPRRGLTPFAQAMPENLKEKTQLKPTDDSTTKTKQPLPAGK